MSEAVAVPQSASHAERGVADTEIAAGFISKQTPLNVRAGAKTDALPPGVLATEGRLAPHVIQPEGDGVEALMEPLRQHDPEERLCSIADAQADTDIAAAHAHAAAVKNHGRNT
ncbi:recombination protein RecR [Micractinium conductrix]|uniref:Recombination protein RecR n=1 Tax=Micractinium conductrix TaxID=554055 RepID=A0A2P6VA32_9CHLO|nr:recombination protein RecR [Micractinium conductrix]|eukprot:PSC70950.1 recombination protein RecR [Micractinium conductrix]